MGTMAARKTIGEMVKAAVAGASKSADITREATRQAENLGEKVASAAPPAPAGDPGDQVEKLAAACEYAADLLKQGASLAGPYHLTEHKTEVGKGPGTSGVTESNQSGHFPFQPNGQGHGSTGQVTKDAPTQKAVAGAATQLKNDVNDPPGFHTHHQPTSMVNQKTAAEKCEKCGKEPCECKEKKAAVTVADIRSAWAKTAGVKTSAPEAEKKETEGIEQAKKGLEEAERAHKSEPENKTAAFLEASRAAIQKTAEDAINPAKISAGVAVPPDTRESGQKGGIPPKGSGPGIVSSNESVINAKRSQTKAEPKADSAPYHIQPALSGEHDTTLRQAFKHTGEAGTKFASAPAAPPPATEGDPQIKTAAARALLTKLAEAASQENNSSPTQGH